MLILFMVYLNAMTSLLHADVLSVEDLTQIQKKLKTSSQLSLDFSQTREINIRQGRPVLSSGHADFQKPDKFKWSILKPKEETYLYNGTSLYHIKENIVTPYKADGERSKELQRIVGLVLNFETLLKEYRVKKAETTKNNAIILLELEPLSKSSDIDLIKASFDQTKTALTYLEIKFKDKNVSKFEFFNFKTKPFEKDHFEVESKTSKKK